MRIMGLIVVFVAFFLTQSIQAKIGETVAQVEARYGKAQNYTVMRTNPPVLGKVYYYQGFDVLVVFVSGRVAAELFQRQEIRTDECIVLAESISGQFGWTKTMTTDALTDTAWAHEDLVAIRTHPLEQGEPDYLCVCGKVWKDLQEKEHSEKLFALGAAFGRSVTKHTNSASAQPAKK